MNETISLRENPRGTELSEPQEMKDLFKYERNLYIQSILFSTSCLNIEDEKDSYNKWVTLNMIRTTVTLGPKEVF